MRRSAAIMIAAAALVALICSGVVLAGTTQKTKRLVTISVSGQPTWLAAPLLLAQDKGIFAKRNLEVNYTVLSPAARFAGLIGGSLQIIDCPLVNMLQGQEAGFKFSVIAPQAGTRRGLSAVMVKKDSPIKRPKDLEGKTLAIASTRGTQEMADRQQLSKLGVDQSKVNYIAVPTSGMVAALQQGRVDAADLTQPFLAEAQITGQFRTLYDSFLAYGPYGSFLAQYCTTQGYVNDHADIVRDFTAAIVEANRYAARHSRETKLILRKVNPALTESEALRGVIGTYPTAIYTKQLQKNFDMAARFGLTAQKHTVAEVLWSGAPRKNK
jgi:NitT/TauT family transport system substrate-binding protein